MANTCETFHFAPTYVAHLFHRGFKSVTLLSMAENLSKKNPMAAQHNKCLSVLNDRRVTPLEPLHSLRRLLQAKRKQAFKLKHVDYLDLANVSPKKQKLPPNRDYRVRYFDTYYRSILENRPKFAETEFWIWIIYSSINRWLQSPPSITLTPFRSWDRSPIAIVPGIWTTKKAKAVKKWYLLKANPFWDTAQLHLRLDIHPLQALMEFRIRRIPLRNQNRS